MRSTALRELERQLETRVGDLTRRSCHLLPVPTGTPLDALLPEGGLPRGQAIEWLGPRSCGKMTLLHATLRRLHAAGEPVAIIDTGHTLYAPDWAALVGEEAFWVVRPPERREALHRDLTGLASGAEATSPAAAAVRLALVEVLRDGARTAVVERLDRMLLGLAAPGRLRAAS